MNTKLLRPYVTAELAAATSASRRGDVAEGWRDLERAHVLSQPSAWLHTRVHLAMFVLAVRTRDLRELAGQLVRLAFAAIGSALGRYPVGNTGRARVPITKPMPVDAELAAILASVERAALRPRPLSSGPERDHRVRASRAPRTELPCCCDAERCALAIRLREEEARRGQLVPAAPRAVALVHPVVRTVAGRSDCRCRRGRVHVGG